MKQSSSFCSLSFLKWMISLEAPVQGSVQCNTTGPTGIQIVILCFLVWILQRAFDGLKSKKLLIMLKRIYHFFIVIAALAHPFQRFALRITGENQFNWNNLLQIHSQHLLHFLWPYDFTFQPVVRYPNIFDNCTQWKERTFLNHWLFVTSHPPIPNSSLFGLILCVRVRFGGVCAYSFHTHKQNKIHVPCDISQDSLDLLSVLCILFCKGKLIWLTFFENTRNKKLPEINTYAEDPWTKHIRLI